MRTVYVISDLHLGGRWPEAASDRGFRMMTEPAALAAFIRRIASETGEVELVINGDFIDFLAEEHTPKEDPWRAFVEDPAQAEAIFRRVADDRDKDVFDALAELLAVEGKRLTVLLGNHDLELSLPRVRAALFRRLGAPRGGLQFIYDGEAYVIGDVLIEHGNRYDPYNEVDHDALRRLRSLQTHGQDGRRAKFEPPVGSRVVAEFLNPIKGTFGFIDLLKPEGAALIALLLAIDPSQRVLGSLLKAGWGRLGHGPLAKDPAMPRRDGVISSSSREPTTPRAILVAEGVFSEELAAAAWLPVGGEISWKGERHVVRLAAYGSWLSEPKRLRHVQAALSVWPDPALPFHLRVETGDGYAEAAQRLTENGFHTVIFGHTHHAKDITFPSGRRYLNTGTWANLMGFPPNLLSDDPAVAEKAWAAFAKDLRENRLEGYITFRPTAARLVFDEERCVEAGIIDARTGEAP
jgi:UDP-2,3-diacylglucosamine pyrophosphatase LpxH